LVRIKANIVSVKAREVLDSRGNPTVESEVRTTSASARASVPSGASKGTFEAVELRDGDPRRFLGRGVLKAVSNVNKILAPKLKGVDSADQRRVDRIMLRLDGTPNKGKLGANAILSVSMASVRAASSASGVSLYAQLRPGRNYTLPVPMMNVLNGGEHAGNDLSMQEFLVEPVGAKSCSEGIRMGTEVYQSLKAVLVARYGRSAINVGDEGGFAPPLRKTSDALGAVSAAIKKAGYGEREVRVGIDAAATTFYNSKSNTYRLDGTTMTPEKLERFYVSLRDEYDLLTVEDPFHEGAVHSFPWLTSEIGKIAKIIGDDLYVTNVKRIRKGIRGKWTNAVLIKLNQIGTVSETEAAIDMAQKAKWSVTVSHRSGETEDPFIAHLATAFGADFIKTGAPARGERVAKYNELLRIQEELGSKAAYAGKRF
jgi:enolase